MFVGCFIDVRFGMLFMIVSLFVVYFVRGGIMLGFVVICCCLLCLGCW